MSNLRIAQLVALVFQVILALPIIGGTIVISTGYTALAVAFFVHVIVLVLAAKQYESKTPAIFGMITNAIAWIPILGWALHLITAILYAYDLFIKKIVRL